jgi:hypothetical protein
VDLVAAAEMSAEAAKWFAGWPANPKCLLRTLNSDAESAENDTNLGVCLCFEIQRWFVSIDCFHPESVNQQKCNKIVELLCAARTQMMI